MIQCLLFGYAATYDLNDVPYAVLDEDRTVASQRLLARFDGSGVFQPRGQPGIAPTTCAISSIAEQRCW